MSDTYLAGVQAAIEKYAARRSMKEIRDAFRAGNLGRANMIAKAPGALKPGAMGHEIKDLGAGGEGLASVVAHPEHGVAVRKLYNPNAGIYSPEIIKRKEELGSIPGMAKFLGAAETPFAHTPVHYNEYVPGTEIEQRMYPRRPFDRLHRYKAPENVDFDPEYMKSLLAANRGAREKGFVPRDLRPANAVRGWDRKVKFIDVLPMKPDEPERNALVRRQRMQGRGNIIYTKPGKNPFENNTEFPPNVGNFMAGDIPSKGQVALRQRSRNDFKRYVATGGRLEANPNLNMGVGYNVTPGQQFAAHQRNLNAPPIKGEVRRSGETISPPGPLDRLQENLNYLRQPWKAAPAIPAAAAKDAPTAKERVPPKPAPQGFGDKVRDLFNQPSPMQKLYRRIRG
jgi:hypothetical protein